MEPRVLRNPAGYTAGRRIHPGDASRGRDGVATTRPNGSGDVAASPACGLCLLLRRGRDRGGADQMGGDRPLPALRASAVEYLLVAAGIRQRAIRVFCYAARARSAAG